MTAIVLQQEMILTLAMWVIGGFLALLVALVVHIGNAGSVMKKQLSTHGERITGVEVTVNNLKESANRIENSQGELNRKIDRLIERK